MPRKAVTKRRLAPRKVPTQQRAKETVDAILAAAAHVLAKDGYEGLNTNRVAERAGVSVGSLYQYFPGKEALVLALLEQHHAEMMALLLTDLDSALPLEELARTVIGRILAHHAENPRLHAALLEELPRIGRLGEVLQRIEEDTQMPLRLAFEARRDEIGDHDPDLAAFLITDAVVSVSHRYALDSRGFSQEAMREGLVKMVVGYLRMGLSPPPKAKK